MQEREHCTETAPLKEPLVKESLLGLALDVAEGQTSAQWRCRSFGGLLNHNSTRIVDSTRESSSICEIGLPKIDTTDQYALLLHAQVAFSVLRGVLTCW